MTTSADARSQVNKELVLGLYEAIRTRDADTFFAGCHPDVVVHEAPSLEIGGIHRGLGEVAGVLAKVIGSYDTATTEIHRIVAEADLVVALVTFTSAGPRPYRVWVSEWWQIHDGKVVEIRPFYLDTQELNAALAAAEPA